MSTFFESLAEILDFLAVMLMVTIMFAIASVGFAAGFTMLGVALGYVQ